VVKNSSVEKKKFFAFANIYNNMFLTFFAQVFEKTKETFDEETIMNKSLTRKLKIFR